MNVNGEQVRLVPGLDQTGLIKELRRLMEQDERKGLGIRFVGIAEVHQLAALLKVNPEGVFPTLAGNIGSKLDFGYSEVEHTLNIWPNRRH